MTQVEQYNLDRNCSIMRRESNTPGKYVGKWQRQVKHWSIIGILAPLLIMIFGSTTLTAYAATGDWPTYLSDNGHSGYNSSETIINPTTAPNLKLHWTHTAAGAISTQPVEANNLIYWGSWDSGNEHATNLSNAHVWTNQLGTTTDTGCNPVSVGVASTSTVATINGRSMLFVGGGNAHFYALDALTGKIIWNTSLGSSPSHFIWSSPAIYNGSVYIGMASFGACSTSEHYTIALVELSASDLSFKQVWQVPTSEQISDGDFGATPTLFTTSTGTPMVGLENKNGKFYAFKRDAIGSGPVWSSKLATGRGSQSSAAWDGHALYVGGNSVTLNGTNCHGSVSALNPDTGAIMWQHCMKSGSVVGAITAVPGLVILGQGTYLMVLNATSGQTLFRFQDTNSSSQFWGWASVSSGVLYIGNADGHLYAFAP